MEIITSKEIFKNPKSFKEVNLLGWVRSNRDNGSIGFISFSDGATIHSIQLVYKKTETENFEDARIARTGAAIFVKGEVIDSIKENQNFEVVVKSFHLLKQSDENYPLQKKEHSPEFLRTIAHLRPRTNKFSAFMKLRSEIAFAIHNFFHQNDFVWVSSPIITSGDAEGAGENFIVNSKDDKNFFGKPAYLSVSGQLHAEAFAQAFKRVYTFGPTFRAEKSYTNRHLAEFWMVEPEVAFCDLTQLMSLIEAFIKFLVKFVLKNCKDEVVFLTKAIDEKIIEKLTNIVETDFAKLEYKDAIKMLKHAVSTGHNFEDNNLFFGKDLATEHERYICEKIFNKPTFLYNYPKEIKSFYMKQNNDGTTVAACDLLVPGVGEIVGGSQREDDYKKLLKKCNIDNMKTADLEWYLNLRKYGYYKSSGFGLGFDRFIMYVTGAANIKDVVPFPRTYGSIDF